MRYRKLLIASSAVCVVASLLLIALWARSYRVWDELTGEALNNTWIQVRSLQGQLMVSGGHDARSPLVPLTWSSYRQFRVRDGFVTADVGIETISSEIAPARFGINVASGFGRVDMPHWIPTGIFLALAAVPWIRWQYSLRTLLVVMTLVAVALGVAVYASR